MIVAVIAMPIVQMPAHDIVNVAGVWNWFVAARFVVLMRSLVRVARMT
ncbi:MAG: hypothetical protein JO233_07060 [Candidatus Eremiobacteraeota bacterium]|nr:hypothetical protein [Candidatus Eremiobacteraeota bacterium]